jgi:RNA polymerase sigma factor (sigma-70 family)
MSASATAANIMGERDLDDLRAANDESLWPLIATDSDEQRRDELETLLTRQVLPVVRKIVAQRQYGRLGPQDAEDIVSSVILRVMRKLQRVPFERADAIERLTDFAASTTLNAIRDFMRRHFPERARLKDRVRYILTRDRRFHTWSSAAGPVCGLSSWPESMATGPVPQSFRPTDPERTSEALESLLRAAGEPLRVGDVVQALADACGIVDRRPVDDTEIVDSAVSHAVRLESRHRLEAVWRETCALPAPQRTALLLNLRDADGSNAIALFALLGVASLEEVAAALELPVAHLATLWPRLPLDDLSIASLLGVTRQQVINLRLSARQRLARRLKQW